MDVPRAFCLECGCDDFHACLEGCWWVRVDYGMGVGVCSECAPGVDNWDRGDRTCSDVALMARDRHDRG